jgi:taurine dioxygenase
MERKPLPVDIQPLQNMGARIRGLDLSRAIPDDVQAELRAAWARYGVLVFPESGRSNEEQLRLSHVFGRSQPHEMEVLIVKDERELIQVSGEQPDEVLPLVVDGRVRGGWLFWHQDESYTTNIPLGSMLRMVTPTTVDGETGYLDIARAYDDLPAAVRERIDDLELVHVLHGHTPADHRFGHKWADVRAARPDEWDAQFHELTEFDQVVHKMVVRHPFTGRKVMLLSPLSLMGVAGMDKAESDELLDMIVDHVLDEKYVYIHKWRANDMVLWDNYTAMHHALGYPPTEYRLGYRTTIAGPTDFKTGRWARAEEKVA